MTVKLWTGFMSSLVVLAGSLVLNGEPSATAMSVEMSSDMRLTRRRRASELISEAERKVMRGEVLEAVSLYNEAEALSLHFEVGAQSWNLLCWYGSLWNQAEAVISACNRAVEMKPDNVEIRDSRGLARALLGDYEGAIDDFQAFVQETDHEGRRFQRQNWIEMLRADENPFTPSVLRMLFVD
ncbi:MAG: hypothetical protein EA395_09005 [Phormidium sp. GEM2.Bin31]|nr:MAG: hypothetical protein EA395_09005 [Phormidium sp. GEM2.Bin31]